MRAETPAGSPSGRIFLVLPLSFVAVSGLALALILTLLRGEAIQSGQRLTQVLAQLTADQTVRTFQSVDQTLQLMQAKLEGIDGGAEASEEDLSLVLGTSQQNRPFLRGIFLLDADGNVVADTGNVMRGSNFADRDYFTHYRDHPQDDFEVMAPVVGRLTGAPTIPATRRWSVNGEFAGVVVASINPAYLAGLWAAEGTGGERSITLYRRDGMVVMQSENGNPAATPATADPALTRLLRDVPQQTVLRRDAAGRHLIEAYHDLPAYPNFAIVVSQTVDLVLSAWRRYAAIAGIGWLACSAVLAGLGFWLRQEWRRRWAAEDELSRSRDRLVALLTHTVDGLVAIDGKGIIFSFNEPAERIFGYRCDEVLGQNVRMLMPEPYRSGHDGYLAAYMKTGIGRIMGTGREVEGQRKDGTVFPMDLAVVEIAGLDEGRQFVGTVRDISRQKAMEEQLQQAQKMEAVGQITGGIAHDFNNLLAVMLGNVELAREANSNAKVASLLDRAMRAAERGAALTARLLAFSRRQRLRPQRVDINRLVGDMAEMMRRTLGETVQIQTSLSAEPLHALVDAGQLENALLNLAVNARDAMPAGGVLTISTESASFDGDNGRASEDYRVITVADTGSGMTPEVRARAFEPFFTTKDVGRGSGLGLSMVYGFVKQSGGHVSIRSEPGQGTTVRLYLPVAGAGAAVAKEPPPPAAGPIGQGQTVLIVEDDDGVRELLATLIEKLGFMALRAADGLQALEILDRLQGADLMITDVVMPKGLSGLALAAKARERHGNMPVIYISGYSSEMEAMAELAGSGATLLSKPFSREQLAEAIQAVMMESQA